MSYRDNISRQIMIYLVAFFFTMSEGMTEFPCTFPSPWIGKTFHVTISGSYIGNWKFNADCQTSISTTGSGPSQSSETLLCHQITERFLVVRVQGSATFVCYSIFYNLEDAPLKFTFGSSVPTTFANQTGEFTDICEICKKPVGTVVAKVPGSPASATQPLSCDIPSMCPSPGIACSPFDIIQKGSGCPILTTETTTTPEPPTTTPDPTTTTPEPTTSPEPKTTTHGHHGHCRKRNHRHP